MLIRIRRSGETPERMVTPEPLVMSRRGVFKTAGMLALAGAAAGCGPSATSQNGSSEKQLAEGEGPDPNLGLYPAKRNESFQVEREITPELYVTSYNNYYEFGVEKDDPRRWANRLPIRP